MTVHGHPNTTEPCVAKVEGGDDCKPTAEVAVNGEVFRTYVERILAPTRNPGDVVVMDNLASHKGAAVRRAIRNAGAHLLFLPPQSPDLNLIEQAFAKLKHRLRHARSRSRITLWRAVGAILQRISSDECANYLKNAGYASFKV